MADNIFAHLRDDLLREAFKDNRIKISKNEYDTFLKNFVFESLKGKRLGQAFAETFGIYDRVLSNYKTDSNAIDHIEWCGYVEK